MTQVRLLSADGSYFCVDHGATGQEHNGLTRLNQIQLLVWHQSDSSGSSSTKTSMLYCGIDRDVRSLCKDGQLTEAIHRLAIMGQQGYKANLDTCVCLLRQCISVKSLKEGQQVHVHILKSGLKPNVYLGNTLINMYSKCGSVTDARKVFDKMSERNVFTWTIMITGYAQHGHGQEALDLFWQMERNGMKPNEVTFVSILKACSSLAALEQGKLIHAHIIKSGVELDVFLGNTLVDMYAKCGSIEHARTMFDRLPKRDVISWNAIIAGYAQHGHGVEALKLFFRMEWEGVKPDEITFVSLLKGCTNLASLKHGKQIHAYVIRSGFESNIFVGSALVDMYGKLGSIECARRVFDKITRRDRVLWTAMIAGYAQHGHNDHALELFLRMEREGVKPDEVTFVSILKACASLAVLEQGKQIHARIIKIGFESDVFVGNALVDMYSKCGSIERANLVFDKMLKRDVVSWNSMLTGYVEHGLPEEAFKLFGQMDLEGVKPNTVTFIEMLKACASLANLEQGKLIHAYIIRSGFESDVVVSSTLIDMYGKCGNIEHAHQVFVKMPTRDIVSWNVMIAGYAQHGQGKKALELFYQMEQEGLKPDEVTFVSILKACSSITALEQGKQIHAQIIRSGFESDVFVGNSLINMYGKCGSIQHARQVFDKMPMRDVVSWNAMLDGYVEHGHGEEAFEFFQQMEVESMKPDKVTLVSMLKACASLAVLKQGKQIHAHIIKSEFESDVFVASTLVDMYAKCGSMEHACRVFNKMPKRDLVSWTAMIAAYAQHGQGKEALQLVEQMQREGMKLDQIIFVSILSACSHAGLLDEGLQYFRSMSRDHGITPSVKHYTCIVDLLGRAGHLEEAENFIKRMPFQSAVVWTALLGACRIHGNLEIAKQAAENILELEPQNTAAFVLLSNIYAAGGRWEDKAKLREMDATGVKKQPEISHIEVNNQVHKFVVEDTLHPQAKEIHVEMTRLHRQIGEAGYVPDSRFVLNDMEEWKELSLCYHSEKLAIAFALISTPPGEHIHIFKNRSVCGDCHTATRFMSKIVGREVVVRDANRFHHFKDGVCTCGDYW